MSIQVIGASGTIADVDGTTWRALKITSRPVEYGLLGQYRLGTQRTGIGVSFAAASVFQARWTDPNVVALIWGLIISGLAHVGSPAASFGNFQLVIARNYTTNGSGGTAISLTGQRVRDPMRQSRMADMRIATGTALTAPTWTLDSQPVGQYVFSISTVTNRIINNYIALYGQLSRGCNPAPLVLSLNEGINVRSTMVITGGGATANFGVDMAWSEVALY